MTATSPPVARQRIPPATAAMLALGGVLLAHLVIVEVLFLSTGTGKNPILTVAKCFGLHVATMMMLQLVLVARLPWLDRRLGMDRLTRWHRWVGFTLLWTVLTHATLVVLGYAQLDDGPVFGDVPAPGRGARLAAGHGRRRRSSSWSAVSRRFARRRLQYETWHALHLLLYVAIVLALVHQLLEGTTFTASPSPHGLLVDACGRWSLGRAAGRPGDHAAAAQRLPPVPGRAPSSRSRTTSSRCTSPGRDLDRLPARAGQFCIWRFPDHNRWWQANPFSLSAAPDGQSLRLTAKAVGSTSAGLRRLPVGTRVFAEGPYGAFTALHQITEATLLIAGGVGITPDPRPAGGVDRAGGRALPGAHPGRRRAARRAAGTGPRARRAAAPADRADRRRQPAGRAVRPGAASARWCRTSRDRDVFVCGPPAMTDAVLRSLRALGVPRAQVHAERFSLA